MNIRNAHFPFWLIAVALVTGLTAPVLIQDGMFMDAMLYTSVSRNLAHGYGTFWFPQFSFHGLFGLPAFHEQPPLVFGIQALFFKSLGDSMYTERVYTFLTMWITIALLLVLWRRVTLGDSDLSRMGWWPVLLWITIPVCFWSYQNNMHENTMGIFTLVAVILFYRSFQPGPVLFSASAAGLFVFLATLSKGVPGFFPLAAPALYWVITGGIDFRKAVRITGLASFAVALIYALLMLYNESRLSLETYVVKRLLTRINEDPTVDHRYAILVRLLQELIAPIAVALVTSWLAKRSGIVVPRARTRLAFFFIALGVAGSAPLMLTMVQKGFYFVPSLPFFGIGFAMLSAPVLLHFIVRLRQSWLKALTGLGAALMATALLLTVSNIGKTSRDHDILHDVRVMKKTFTNNAITGINPAAWNNWELQCYLMRYCDISISPNYPSEFFMVDRALPENPPEGYRKLDLVTRRYDLYQRW